MKTLNSNNHSFILLSTLLIASGGVSLSLCLAAEFKKSKKSDLRIEGKQCYVPKSAAWGLGIAALVCLCVGQVIGNFFVWRKFRSRDDQQGCCCCCCGTVRKPTVSCILIILSWIFFVVAVILLSAASSMSQTQPVGEGWLDGNCYLVKNGVYAGSALLSLLALGSTLGSATVGLRQRQTQVEENRKVHAHLHRPSMSNLDKERR